MVKYGNSSEYFFLCRRREYQFEPTHQPVRKNSQARKRLLKEKSRKRLCQYAEDGINFARQYKRQHLCTKSPGVTPGRTTTSEKPSGDLAFVTNERAQLAGRFNWASCYGEGRSVGMFIRYSSHTSLK